jgi:hypothetical protein
MPAPAAQPHLESRTPALVGRRKRRKRHAGRSSEPLLSVFGIDITVTKLLVVAVFLAGGGVGLFWWLTSETRVQGQRVEVYTAIRRTEHRVFPKSDLLVTRSSPEGPFVLVTVKIPQQQFNKRFGEARGPVRLPVKEIQLQSDGEPVSPLFLVSQGDAAAGFSFKYATGVLFEFKLDPDRDQLVGTKEPPPLYEALGPAPGSDWKTDGELKIDKSATAVFQGKRGMRVEFKHIPLQKKLSEFGLLNPSDRERRRIQKEIQELNQAVQVTWDASSTGWLAATEVEQPSEMFLFGWELPCVFPLPPASKGLKLVVLGQPVRLEVR